MKKQHGGQMRSGDGEMVEVWRGKGRTAALAVAAKTKVVRIKIRV